MTSKRRFPDFLRTVDDPAGSRLDGPLRTVVFHHQPKTAGSTFRQILESLFRPDEVCPGEIDDEVTSLSAEERAGYRLYAGHYRYDTIDELLPNALWLVMIRNPIDRVVSNYYNVRDPKRYGRAWIRRANERPGVKGFLAKVQEMTLEEFVFSDLNRARDRVVNRQTRYLVRREMHAKRFPVYEAEIVEAAKRNLRERFVYIGVQEHFQLSLDLLLMTFGLPPIEDRSRFNPNINVRERKSHGYDIPDNVREHLEAQNRMDLEIWDYAKTLMFERLRVFQDRLIEQSYVLRHETEGTARPPRAAGAVEPAPTFVIRQAIKRRLPESIKRILRSTTTPS